MLSAAGIKLPLACKEAEKSYLIPELPWRAPVPLKLSLAKPACARRAPRYNEITQFFSEEHFAF